MNLLSINPYVRFPRVQKKPLLREAVIGLDHRIFFCAHGEGEIAVKNQPYRMCSGSFLFVRAGIPYENVSKTDEMVLLAYNFDLFCKTENMGAPISFVKADAFQRAELVEPDIFQDMTDIPDVFYLPKFYKKDVLQEIIDEYNRKRIYYNERCSALLKDTLLCAVRANKEECLSKQKSKAEALLYYIREHFSEPLTNAIVAQQFSYHQNYLNQLLKESTGQTLHQYLLDYRIKTAISLLKSGEYTVTEVAKLVGFPDIFHFSKTFKKLTGNRPSYYLP